MNTKIISTLAIGVIASIANTYAEEVAVPTLYTQAVTTSAPITTSPTETTVVIPSLSIPSSVEPGNERLEIVNTKNLTKLKSRGAQLIKERVNSLNQNAEAISKSKNLTEEQKSSFSLFFSGKVAELNALGVKIKDSTEATSTKALVESIFTDFRIYGVTLPQVRLQKRIYEVQNHVVKLSEAFDRTQSNIDYAKSKNRDVTEWQKNLDAAKLVVATDTAKLSGLMTQINSLKPSDYGTTSKNVIMSVNADLRTISKEISYLNKKIRKPTYMKTIKATTTQVTSSTTNTN